MSYTWAKFNLLSIFSFLVLYQATTAASSSSCSNKGGTHTTVNIDEWSLIGYVSALIIFVHIGYCPFGYSIALFLCLYLLLINIFSPCIVGGWKVAFCIGGSFFWIYFEAFLDRCVAFLIKHENLILLRGRKT